MRVKNGYTGSSLIYEAPSEAIEDKFFIPEEPILPPWLDEDYNYYEVELTLIDGEWVDLEQINIKGDQSYQDIDLNDDNFLT